MDENRAVWIYGRAPMTAAELHTLAGTELEQDPDSAEWHYWRSIAREALEDYRGAWDDACTALELGGPVPDDRDIARRTHLAGLPHVRQALFGAPVREQQAQNPIRASGAALAVTPAILIIVAVGWAFVGLRIALTAPHLRDQLWILATVTVGLLAAAAAILATAWFLTRRPWFRPGAGSAPVRSEQAI